MVGVGETTERESAHHRGVSCCANATQLFDFIETSPLAVLNIRTLPVASMFPDEVLTAIERLPQSIHCGVVTPAVAMQVGVDDPRLGDVLVFRRGELIHRGSQPGLMRRLHTLLGLTTDRPPPPPAPSRTLRLSMAGR